MGDQRDKKKRGLDLAPTPLVALLNLVHLLIGGICTFGAYVMVHSLLPMTIFLSMGVLGRFHDYCWLTKITQAVENAGEACKETDVHPHAPFFNRFTEGLADEHVSDRVVRNGTALLIAINVCVAVYRLSDRYKFTIVPGRVYGKLVAAMVLAWVLSEVYIYTVYEDKPFCEACELPPPLDDTGFTPIAAIRINE